MAKLRPFGMLQDDGECLYGYSSLADLLESAFEEGGPIAGQTLIRIDSYTVLAEGSDEKAQVFVRPT